MKIKVAFQRFVRKAILTWSRYNQNRHIHRLIKKMKLQGNLRKYPLKNSLPLITDYSFYKKSDLRWLDFYYSVNGNPDPNFISVPIYYYCETCLNNRMLTYALKEKNFYNKFMRDIPTPATILRRINGFYYDERFSSVEPSEVVGMLSSKNKIILKPTVESGGGSSILVFENQTGQMKSGGMLLNIEFLNSYTKDIIIQEFVEQHRFFSQFNPTSNNTLRVFTYRSVRDDSVNILHCLLRIGASGSYLDHDHLGGVVLSIDENNHVSKHAIDLFGNKYSSVNNIIFSTLDEVPAMEEVRSLATKIAGDIYYGRILALDFTVDKTGKPLLLEINCWRNGINQYQMHNGGLFRGFTSEILDYTQKQTPQFVLNF